ncbi:MAG TPA: hypothetical protein VHF89_11230 [Solirubrobacteraceae bacterium]|nr:hypothetical protein [Solirubrobacteraceae bacterium]
MKANVLVVAHRTATSDDLLAALRGRAETSPARFELLVPPRCPGPEARSEARAQLEAALARMQEFGLEATGAVGSDDDPVVAVIEAYEPRRHDEVIVSTLPAAVSRWLGHDTPARISRATGALVRHVVSREQRRRAPVPVHVEKPAGNGVLSPFVVLGWGPRG